MEGRVRDDLVRAVCLTFFALCLGACRDAEDLVDNVSTGVGEPASRIPLNRLADDTSGNRIPLISGTPKTESAADVAYVFQPQAHDADGDRLGFSIRNQPHWASFNPSTGQLSGIPTDQDIGVYDGVVISVSDGRNGASLPSFSIHITEASDDPVGPSDEPPAAFVTGSVTLSWLPPTENVDGSPSMDLAGFKILYGPANGGFQQVIDIPNPGVVTYVVEGLTAGTYSFVTTAYAASGLESDHSNTVTATLP